MVNMLLKPLMGASFIGGALAVIAILIDAPSSYYAAGLVACIAATALGMVSIQLALRRKRPGQPVARVLLGGSPRWMWQVAVVLALVGFALWLKLGGMTNEPAQDATSLFVAAVGLIVCPPGFASFYSYWLQRHELSAAKA